MKTPSTITYTIDLGLLGEVDVEVDYFYDPGTPGRYSGPPENCYPDEPAELELVAVRHELLSPRAAEEVLKVLEENGDLEQCVAEELADEDAAAAESYYESLREGEAYAREFWNEPRR